MTLRKQACTAALAFASIGALAACSNKPPLQIALPGERVYPESIASTSDGALYVGSLASGGVARIKDGNVEQWIAPGAYGTRSTFGVLADETAGVLWVCSNDVSGLGVPGPGAAQGSNLKAFDLDLRPRQDERAFSRRRQSLQ